MAPRGGRFFGQSSLFRQGRLEKGARFGVPGYTITACVSAHQSGLVEPNSPAGSFGKAALGGGTVWGSFRASAYRVLTFKPADRCKVWGDAAIEMRSGRSHYAERFRQGDPLEGCKVWGDGVQGLGRPVQGLGRRSARFGETGCKVWGDEVQGLGRL